MASLNFYIEKRKNPDGSLKRDSVPIMLYFSYEGKRFQFYTGERSTMEKWDPEKQRLVEKSTVDRQVNACLDYLSERLWETYRSAKASGIRPGREYLRNSLNDKNKSSSYDFFEVFMRFIEHHHEKWSIGTFRKVKTIYNQMRKYSDHEGLEIRFERMDQYFFDNYIRYFRDVAGHSNATIHKNVMMLKWFLNWATESGYNRNRKYRDYQFPWPHQPKHGSNVLSLNFKELSSLLDCSFKEKRLEIARDVFCFMCLTGIRYSELESIVKESVSDDSVLVEAPGTFRSRRIPLNSLSKKILRKYLYQAPARDKVFPGYSTVSMNRLIKLAGREAGIDAPVEVARAEGDNIMKDNIPKWQALSTKIAVNTFIMNAFELDIPVRFIMDYTGMRSIEGMKRYETMYREYEAAKTSEMHKFSAVEVINRENGKGIR